MPKNKTYIDPANIEGLYDIATFGAQSISADLSLLNRLRFSAAADKQVMSALDRELKLQKALRNEDLKEYLGDEGHAAIEYKRKLLKQRENESSADRILRLTGGGAGVGLTGQNANMADIISTEELATMMSPNRSRIIRDNINSFLQKLNETQSSSAIGIEIAQSRMDDLINAATEYYTIQTETIPSLLFQLDLAQASVETARTPLARQAFLNRAARIKKQLDSANQKMSTLKPLVDLLKKEADKSWLGHSVDGLFLGERGSFGSDFLSMNKWDEKSGSVKKSKGLGEKIWGEVTPFHDRTNDVLYYLYGLGDDKISPELKLIMLRRAKNESDTVHKDMQAIIKENDADSKKYNNRISNLFKRLRDEPGMDLTDPATYLFKLSGVMGSSASSWMKQGAGMAAGILASAAAVPTGGASLAAAAPFVFSMNQSSGRDENYAEVQLAVHEAFINRIGGKGSAKYKQLIGEGKKLLGNDTTEDQVIDNYLSGNVTTTNGNIDRAKITVAMNIPSLFNRDMAATTWDSTVDTALSLTPIGALSGLSKVGWVRGIAKGVATAEQKMFMGNAVGRGFVKGFEAGANAGSALSVLGAPITGVAAGIANGARVAAGKGLEKLGKLGRGLNRAFDKTAELILHIDPSVIGPKAAVATKYVKDISGKLVTSAISEGVEEGKQHLYADQFKKGEFKYGDDTLFNIALDDTMNGFKMGALIAGIPLDGIGLLTLKDEDLLADIKGGMLGGMLHVGTVNVVLNVRPFVQEMRATDAILKNLIAENTQARDIYNKSLLYAKQGWALPSRARFASAFNSLRNYNNRYKDIHGESVYDNSLIDDEEKRMNQVFAMMNNSYIKLAALDIGIINNNTGTDLRQWIGTNNPKYQRFVASIATVRNLLEQAQEARKQIADSEGELDNQFMEKLLSLIDEFLDSIYKNTYSEEDSLTPDSERRDTNEETPRMVYNKETKQYEWATKGQRKEEYKSLAKLKLDDLKDLARLSALMNMLQQIRSAMEIAQQSTGTTSSQKTKVLNSQKQYLNWINAKIKLSKAMLSDRFDRLTSFAGEDGKRYSPHANDYINTVEDINKLVQDPEAFDKYVDFFSKLYKADLAVDMHNDTLKNILGEGKDKNFFDKLDKQIAEANISDDQFWDAFNTHDFSQEDLDNSHHKVRQRNPKTGEWEWVDTDNTDNLWRNMTVTRNYEPVAVFDDDGKLVKLDLDEDGNPKLKLGKNQLVDQNGYLYQIPDPSVYEYQDKPIYGEWDKTARENAKEEFKQAIGGGYVRIDPKDDKNPELKLIFLDIKDLQNHQLQLRLEELFRQEALKKKQAQEEADRLTYIDESEEGGNTITEEDLLADKDIMNARKRDERSMKKATAGAKKTDLIAKKYDTRWNVWTEQKGSRRRYFIIRRDKNGNNIRDYNIDPKNIYYPKRKYVAPTSEVRPNWILTDSGEVVINGPKKQYLKPSIKVLAKMLPAIPAAPQRMTPQDISVIELRKKQLDDQRKVADDPDGYHTTSQAYFILNEDTGKYERWPRLHAVLNSDSRTKSYERPLLENAAENTYEQIKDKSQSELEDWIDEQVKGDENLKYGLIPYKKFLLDNPNLSKNDLDEIKNDLKWIVNPGDFGDPVRIGNLLDSICRLFFDSQLGYKMQGSSVKLYANWLMNQIFDHEPQYKIGDYVTDKDILENIVLLLVSVQQFFDNKGWKVSTFPYTWYAKFNNTKVAGQTDLIAVDQLGGYHIVDFKTAKNGFGASFYEVAPPNPYYDGMLLISKADNYSAQQTSYAMMMRHNLNGPIKSASLLGILVSYYSVPSNHPVLSGAVLVIDKKPNLIPMKWSKPAQDVLDTIDQNTLQEVSAKLQKALDLSTKADGIKQTVNSALQEFAGYTESYAESQLIFLYLQKIQKAAESYSKLQVDDKFDPLNNNADMMTLDDTIQMFEDINELYQQISDAIDNIKQQHAQWLLDNGKRGTGNTGGDNGGSGLNSGGDGSILTLAHNKGDGRGAAGWVNLNYHTVEQDPELRKATIAPDFIKDSVVKVWSRTYNGQVDLFCSIEYHGKVFKGNVSTAFPKGGIHLFTRDGAGNLTKVGSDLIDKVLKLEKENPGKDIYAVSMNRTNGRIAFYKDKSGREIHHPVKDTDLVGDLYDVELSPEYNRLGFFNRGAVQVFVGGNDKQRLVIYQYPNDYGIPEQGVLVMLKKVLKDEVSDQNRRVTNVPVTIRKVKFSETDADFIIRAISEKKLDETWRLSDERDTGTTLESLINLLIPTARNLDEIQLVNTIYFSPQSKDSQVVSIINKQQLDDNGQLRNAKWYDLSTDEGKSNFKQDLMGMFILEQHAVLTSRLGTSNTKWLPFASIRKFFANKRNSDVKNIKVTDSISFDFSDFAPHDSIDTGRHYEGLSGAGWYMSHGLWLTTYDHMEYSNVSIGDVDVIDDNNTPATNANGVSMPAVPDETDELPGDLEEYDPYAILDKKVEKYDPSRKKINQRRAEKRLTKILGKDAKVEFVDLIKGLANEDGAILGQCYADAILLSKSAYDGVEFHEAFHRVIELLMDDKERNKVYKEIATLQGFDLSTKEGITQTAEYAADGFMNYMSGYMEVNIPIIRWLFNKVRDWVLFNKHQSERDVYKAYAAAARGKFKTREATSNNIRRFKTLFKHLNYMVHGIEFKHIVNAYMYDQLKLSTMYFIMNGANVDKSGRDIDKLGKHIDLETFKAGVDKFAKRTNTDPLGENLKEEDRSFSLKALAEMYDHLKYLEVRDDIANEISFIATDYKKVDDDLSEEETNAGSSIGNNIGEHTRLSYEFSRFSKTTSRVRYFFSTIPDQHYVKREFKDGVHIVPTYTLNELGLPTFTPVGIAFNDFINQMHDCDTVYEIILKSSVLGKSNPLFSHIARALKNIYKNTYIYDAKTGRVNKNDDYEALLVLLINTIRSNKHNFDIVRSTEGKDNEFGHYTLNLQSTDMDYNSNLFTKQWGLMLVSGGTNLIKTSSTGVPQLNPKNKFASLAFRIIADRITHEPKITKLVNGAVKKSVGLKEWLNNVEYKADTNEYVLSDPSIRFDTTMVDEANSTDGKIKYKPVSLADPMSSSDLSLAKDAFLRMLNSIGVQFTLPELDYMLLNKYGSTDFLAMQKMFNAGGEGSMESMINFLKSFVVNGKISRASDGTVIVNNRKVQLQDAYTKMAFLRELGNWKYNYLHSHDTLTVLASHGKYYQISDNNYITDVARDLNKRGDIFQELASGKDPYYYDSSETDAFGRPIQYGSRVVAELVNNPKAQVEVYDFVGFKTDKKGDTGSDYFEITNREDYVAKAQILSLGYIIFPTMSDKKTWKFMKGINLPGLQYGKLTDDNGNIRINRNLGLLFIYDDNGIDMLTQLDSVIDQFMSYAISEYKSILKTIEDLKLINSKEENKRYATANYYDKLQGARFSSLLGVINDDGKYISFNDGNKTPEENLKVAEREFFSKDEVTQRKLIARNLMYVLDEELEKAVDLGLIKKAEVDRGGSKYFNYDNIGLDSASILAIYTALTAEDGGKNKIYAKDEVRTDDKDLEKARYKSLAIVIYLNDVSNRAIMSGQEIERLYSGNPASYKWKYDKDTGVLYDRTVDELKRLGGLVSTGTNNFIELQDIPEKYLNKDGIFTGEYVCAEVDNEMVTSKQYDLFKDSMYEGQLRTSLYTEAVDKRSAEYLKSVYKLPNDERPSDEEKQLQLEKIKQEESEKINEAAKGGVGDLEKYAREQRGDVWTDLVQKKALDMSDSFRIIEGDHDHEGIDVADGAAYVSDTMMEMILRMNGSWSSDIAKAFELLRDDDVTNVTQKAAAYLKVITTVIGTQKYTAFGRRTNALTGTPVTYYHKYALFPIFKSMATGKLMNVYLAMDKQGVDMLLINSGVKVGSEGSLPIKWDNYRQDPNDESKPMFSEAFKFNTYNAKFAYLRKQLNTDPDEEKYRTVGTLMTKIVESNWVPYNNYVTNESTPRTMSGKEILRDIMDSTNKLSEIGLKEVYQLFFKTNDKNEFVDADGNVVQYNERDDEGNTKLVLDLKKFSKEVRQMLSAKDPNRNILRALDVVENNGEYSLRMPLDAVQNSKWMESILISRINSKVIDVETPGAPFIQRSVWAMEGKTMPDTKRNGTILSDKNLPKSINGGKRLQTVNEEGSMDCVLSIDFFKKILTKNGKNPFMHAVKDDSGKVVYEFKKDKNGNKIRKARRDKNNKIIKNEKGEVQYEVDANGNYVYETLVKMTEMSFLEMRAFLINRGIIGGPHKGPKTGLVISAKANIVAYRIPTQALSSIHALRCVDVIPDVNDTVILPEEFTKITGSDFDIDKLFLNIVNYDMRRENDANGSHLIITDQFKEGTKKYYQNKLLRDYIAMLLDKDSQNGKPRHFNILHRSIDTDTLLSKNVLADIEGNAERHEERPYQFYSLWKQSDSKNDYITGKIGIGPYALNNNNHILTMLYDVRFSHNPNSILWAMTEYSDKVSKRDGGQYDAYDFESLGHYSDRDGNSIFSWLSGLINGHVDIAKDPWVGRLNINPFTYNISNLLVRVGLGRNALYFLCLPIMKELATAYNNASSKFMQDESSTFVAQQKELLRIADMHFKDSGVTTHGFSYEDIVRLCSSNGLTKEDLQLKRTLNSHIAKMILSDDIRKLAKTKGGTESDLLLVYAAYLQFDRYANSLSSLVKYCKIDTKKQGKSVIEQQAYKAGYESIFGSPNDNLDPTIEDPRNPLNDDSTTLIDKTSRDRLRDDSYIGTKTRNALLATTDILSLQFIEASPAFLATVKYIINAIGKGDSKSAWLYDKVSQAVSAAVKSLFFNEALTDQNPYSEDGDTYNHGNPNFMHDLVSSSHDISRATFLKNGHITLSNPIYHTLQSYVGKSVTFAYRASNGKSYRINGTIVSADDTGVFVQRLIFIDPNNSKNNRAIELPGLDLVGYVELKDGANTMFDRLARLKSYIMTVPELRNLRTLDGLISNLLLRNLVSGSVVDHNARNMSPAGYNNQIGAKIDTYDDLKFVKLFNFLEEGGSNANYIIDAWDELLNYKNDNPIWQKFVRDFASDLVFYAFMTSGDTSGFTKIFKYVPYSWREKSGYSSFIAQKFEEFKNPGKILDIDIDDVILNNWTDNTFVPTYQLNDRETNLPNFITVNGKNKAIRTGIDVENPNTLDDVVNTTSYPVILAALHKESANGPYVPFIDPYNSPEIIKIPRVAYKFRTDALADYTVYRKAGIAKSKDGVEYPVYVKVEPKGNSVKGGFMVTEYGRSDSMIQSGREYSFDPDAFDRFWGDNGRESFILNVLTVKANWGVEFAATMLGLRRELNLLDTLSKFDKNKRTISTSNDGSDRLSDEEITTQLINYMKDVLHIPIHGREEMIKHLKEHGYPNIQAFLGRKARDKYKALITKYRPDMYGQDVDAFNEIDDPDELPFFKTSTGEIYGFVTPDNQIYLDETVIRPEIPIHEYTHIWDEVVYRNNRPLWDRGVLLMKLTQMWNTIESSKEYGEKWRKAGFSADKIEYYIASEVHARLTGKHGANTLDKLNDSKNSNIIDKLREWIKEFWSYIKDTFSIWSNQDLSNLSVEEFVNMPLRDFVDRLNLYNVQQVDYGKEQSSKIRLTLGLREAKDLIDKFADDVASGRRDGSKEYFMLSGKAGTGKTTLINQVVKDILNAHPEYNFLIGAISHKATLVIASKVGKGPKYATLASMLGIKLNQNTGTFERQGANKPIIHGRQVIIIDEASMINEVLFNYFMDEVKYNGYKDIIIFIGDEGLLPPIRGLRDAIYYALNHIDSDDISHIISDNKDPLTSYVLKERVRQGEGSPILEYGDMFWNYSVSGKVDVLPSSQDEFRHRQETALGSLEFFNKDDLDKTIPLFKDALRTGNPNLIKIVAYRVNKPNDTVNQWNEYIRRRIYGNEYTEAPKAGDIVTADDQYTRNNNPNSMAKPSEKDAIINSKDYVISEVVSTNTDSNGISITTVKLKGKEGEWQIVTPTPGNLEKFDYVCWNKLWPEVQRIKREDPRSYNIALKKFWSYRQKYARFKYGYAITSHKSQGSTYDVVVVDSPDINSVGLVSPRSKARSIYTALTRARNVAIILRRAPSELQGDVKELNDRINTNKGNNLTITSKQNNNIQTYTDVDNQFDDSDFSDEYMKHCKL